MMEASKIKVKVYMDNLTPPQLKELSMERLAALYDAGRCDGAFYICGYALEMGLKYKICRILDWASYYEYNNWKT